MLDSSLNSRSTEPASGKRERRRVVVWMLGALVLVLLGGLVAQQLFLWSVVPGPESAIEALLLLALSSVILLLFVIVAFILVRNLLKLRRERGEGRFGSRLKTRLITYFIALSLLPITVMALFSYTFLNRSLEKWFGSFPQDIVTEAKLAQTSDTEQSQENLRRAAELAGAVVRSFSLPANSNQFGTTTQPVEPPNLNDLARRANFDVLLIINSNGQVLARGAKDGWEGTPSLQLLVTRLASDTALAAPTYSVSVNNILFDVARVTLDGGVPSLVAARERQGNNHLRDLALAAERFEQLRLSQRWVRGLGLTTLALLTLLLLFATTWTADHLARSIVTPLRALAEASEEVARGNLTHRVSEIADDELAALATSFNSMTSELEENRRSIEAGAHELNAKNSALEERRAYIETVLASLSTGVISLDEHDRVTTINSAARLMLQPLGVQHASSGDTETSKSHSQMKLYDIACMEDVAILERVVRRARRAERATEQTSLMRAGATRALDTGEADDSKVATVNAAIPVALTATALQARDTHSGEDEEWGRARGVVLVMEDLSELLAAQRAAAWSEVARRMAHEIKNPLTPIQLSAERIARHFKRLLENDAAANNTDTTVAENAATLLDTPSQKGDLINLSRISHVVEECTETIVREVSSLKSMVDEFSRFAQLPAAQLVPGDLNGTLRQAVALYEGRLEDLRLEMRLASNLPFALFDEEQMRRVFVNLLENATEAVMATSSERRITVATGYDARRGVLLAEIADNGHGIKPGDYPRLFQPYFSTRDRGTGLGLAIVHRIIADHGGRIQAEPNFPRGARFRIELPADERSAAIESQKVASQEVAADEDKLSAVMAPDIRPSTF